MLDGEATLGKLGQYIITSTNPDKLQASPSLKKYHKIFSSKFDLVVVVVSALPPYPPLGEKTLSGFEKTPLRVREFPSPGSGVRHNFLRKF